MARPAGYSSDEDCSDDGLTFCHDEVKKKRTYCHRMEEENEPKGDKLLSAVTSGNIDEVKEYIDNTTLNYKSKKFGNWNALMQACSQGNVEMVELLLEKGADPKEHFQLRTPLHCVCDSKKSEELSLLKCIGALLEHGALLNAKDWYSMTPLSYAVKNNLEKVVLKLLSIGGDIDCEDSDGWTPIFYAVDGGFTNLVQILKDSGASIRRVDRKGRTLYDIATAKYFKVIAEMVNITDKLVEIDDIIDNYRNYQRMSSYECVLSELPDKKKGRFYGFSSDAARWIHGIGLETLVKLFVTNQIQLGEILTADDQQLKDLGVEFSYDRTKIRYCVQNFHQHSWGKNSLRDIKDDVDLHTAAVIICNAIKQLYIVSTATYFWKKHDGHEVCKSKKDCINKGLYYVKFLRKEIDLISKIVHEIEEKDDIEPCDLILPKGHEGYSWLDKKQIVIIVTFLALMFKARKYFYPFSNITQIRFPFKSLFNMK